MNEISILIWGIIAVLVVILLTIIVTFIYSGLFSNFQIGAGKPPIQNVYVGYKFGQGPYNGVGPLFTEACACAPDLRCFGIYYDNPNEVDENKTRYVVGSILAEGEEKPDEKIEALMQERGFKFHHLPAVSSCVRTMFPFNTFLSCYLAVMRVYPALDKYIQEHRLCAYPMLEIYDKNTIHFMAPLAKQDEFNVPEAEPDGDDDVDGITEYSSGSRSYGDSSVDRLGTPLSEELNGKDEPAPQSTPAEGDKVTNGEEQAEPGTQAANGHESGSEQSSGTGSSFEEVNMDLDELKTAGETVEPGVTGDGATGEGDAESDGQKVKDDEPVKQASAEPRVQD